MVNTLKLKARIMELGLTQKDIAEKLNLAAPTVSQKINNIRAMSLEEAFTLSKILKIDISEFDKYFFCNGVA
ncbi:helix-turn-helix transcriptional regulator [Clostridium sp. KNHs214]|uniref:helix-turn-helix domain-containing protein n=1 Tax=Clostridium sp. KNHs214 TaxID=1540257 RepID=UPI000550824F|nr:helix-turn-helix transcriptional regulator [Clostridium sp. KNHs214]